MAGLALSLVSIAVYAPLRPAGFIWDDDVYVTENALLRTPAGLLQIWLVPGATPQYYPLVHTTFWLEYQAWGLWAPGYHAVNVLLHAASSVLLWRVLARLGLRGAWVAAALFAVHPVMTESVAWVTERKNVLSLAFALGSLLAYLRFDPLDAEPAERRPTRAYLASLALFACALLAKTVACSLPAVIAVLVWWKRGRLGRRDLAPLVPFFALGIALALQTVWLEKHRVGARGAEWALSPAERIVLAGRALWFYAGKLFWPHPLLFFYPRWTIDAHSIGQLLAPATALATVGALWLARRRLGRGPLATVLIFAGVLTPALGFFDVYPFRYSFVADHFSYHASAALIAGVVVGGATFAARFGAAGTRAAQAAAIAAGLALAALTLRQTRVYLDFETLCRHTIAGNPGAWQAYSLLAGLLADAGRYDEAIATARDGVTAAPSVPEVYNTLGAMWMTQASREGVTPYRLEQAITNFEITLRLDPDYEETHFNLAQALTAAGRHREAGDALERVLVKHPGDVDARVALGRALRAQGLVDRAEGEFAEALRRDPASADALYELGTLARRRGDLGVARERYEAAARLRPDNAYLRSQLGEVLLELEARTSP
jgi:tetratricopeptide (TPR) repeat protein